jgi:hypothetical protein
MCGLVHPCQPNERQRTDRRFQVGIGFIEQYWRRGMPAPINLGRSNADVSSFGT